MLPRALPSDRSSVRRRILLLLTVIAVLTGQALAGPTPAFAAAAAPASAAAAAAAPAVAGAVMAAPAAASETLAGSATSAGTVTAQHTVSAQLATATGLVTAADGSGPVTGVVVKALTHGSVDFTPVTTATTDSTGSWTMTDLPPGDYDLQFDASDTAYLSQWWSAAATRDSAGIVSASAGGTLSGLDAALTRGATVSGRVVDTSGQPLPDVLVTPREQAAGAATSSAGITAADGTFTVRRLAAGTYTLDFGAAGHVAWSYGMKGATDSPAFFAVPEGAAVTGRSMVLPAGNAPAPSGPAGTATMNGAVHAGSTGSPLAGAIVVAVAADSDPLAGGVLSATTDDTGAWTLTGLPADVYTVHVLPPVVNDYAEQWWNGAQLRSHAAYAVVAAGTTRTGMDATLVRAGSISGKVTAGGTAGIAGVVVQAAPVGTETWASVTTGADGNFMLGALAPGAYDLQFDGKATGFQPAWWSDSSGTGVKTRDAATPITVAAGATVTGRDVVLALAGSLVGTVTGPGGAPVPGATIEISAVAGGSGSTFSVTDAGGNYDSGGLPAGDYVVKVTPPPGSTLAAQYYDNASSLATASPFPVVDGLENRADFVLSPGGSVSGRVLRPDGTPAVTASLMVAPAADPSLKDIATVNADGTFAVSGLGPGSYVVSAVDDGTLVTYYATTGSPVSPSSASPVALAAGATVTGLTIRLAPGASISGRVTEGAVSASSGQVTVTDVRTGAQLGSAGINGGSYTVSGLPAGTYAVMATGSTDASRWFGNTTTWADSTFVVLARAAARTGVDIALPAAGPAPGPTSTVSGHVTLPAGATSGLASLDVWVEDAAGFAYSTFSINGDGTFEIFDVPDGTLSVHLRDFDHELVLAPQTVTAPTATVLEVQPVIGASIAGRLVNAAGKPLANVDVTAVGTVGTVGAVGATSSALSDADGAFRLGGLPAGPVRLHVTPTSPYAATWVGGTDTPGSGTVFTLTLGSTTAASDVVVPLGGTVAGTVTVPPTARGSQVTVEALDAGNRVVGSTTVVGTAGYQLGGLLPGVVRVRFSAAALATQLWTAPGAGSPSDVTILAGQTVDNVDATLAPPATGTASIAGTIAAQGIPIARAKVTAVRSDDGQPVAPVTSDASGRYVLPALPAGSYKVQAQACLTSTGAPSGGPLCATRWWQAAKDAAAAKPVTVTDGASLTGIDVELSSFRTFTAAPTPTISGTARVGLRLTAVPGTWGPAPVTLAYQWRRNGAAITGATASTYLLGASDRTTRITVTVTGRKTGYLTAARTSTATAAVATGVLTATPVPTITGTARVGLRLTATAGTWAPAPVTPTYQWRRNGVAITGATASTYLLGATDRTARITVTVTGSKVGYTSVARTSAATLAVATGILTAAPVPRITGTTRVGSRLTAVAGTWSPAPVTLSYQWRRNGLAITGATGSTYLLARGDRGTRITVTVTGRKTAYATVARTSAATAAIG